MSDTGDNESVAQSRDGQEQVDDNVVPASDNEEEDPIAELYGDEREEYEEEDANGEDLFRDDMLRDYRDQPELDNLSASGIDDTSDITELSFDARRRAEIAMARRDQLSMEDELYWEDGDESAASLARRRKRLVPRQPEDDIDEDDGEVPIDILENYHDRSARDHCSDEAVGREIFRRFKKFLNFFKEPVTNQNKYILAIRHMVAENRLSLEVDYNDLSNENGEPHIAFLLPEAPVQVLERLDQAATAVVTRIFPWYKRVTNEVKVRVKNLPSEEDIRLLRQIHLNMLIKTSGVVTVTTGILPQLSVLKYDCKSCSFVLGPFVQRQDEETKPTTCPSCQSRGPFELNTEETIYHNYQRITIQESPNLVAAGRLPRSKEVILLGDLCDSCKPGDEIELTGIYTNSYDGSLNTRQGFPVFNTVIIANHIVRKDRLESDSLTDEDIKAIRELAKHPQIAQRIFASIAPTIYGHDDVKQAVGLALFRGQAKNPQGKHRIRGDINVLLCGDPGTAKSQFLRYVAHLAPRSILTTGQGASAVGLTAYVQRHPVTREWTLEAGAMVLADTGVCLIDEFDKMNEQDRTSIHEAMEQQSISISKAGIVTSLKARCTVIAAANPIGGRYDSSRTFAANVDLSEPILSRFDIFCVIRDQPDPVDDEHMADFIIKTHKRLHPDVLQAMQETAEEQKAETEIDPSTGLELIPHSLLRKYIIYAREHIHPVLNIDDERISRLYSDLRKESGETGSMVITIRNVESMIRMAEANAKIHLRTYVDENDVAFATKVMLQCFINTQKASVMQHMKKKFWKQLSYKRDNNELLLFTLKQLVNEQIVYERARHGGSASEDIGIDTISVSEEDLVEKARQLRIDAVAVRAFFKSKQFIYNKFNFDAQRKIIVKTIA
uniref:DNA replication licensing factor MCM2 n=1 Tax=Meloidogyne enterolobii TaxID=390850 RepID=A0A6V7U978_MELEN|nr:unnamed protein product [Meloidogyne enterolobii]